MLSLLLGLSSCGDVTGPEPFRDCSKVGWYVLDTIAEEAFTDADCLVLSADGVVDYYVRYYEFSLAAERTVEIATSASAGDPWVMIHNRSGGNVKQSFSPDFKSVRATLAPGTYVLSVRSYNTPSRFPFWIHSACLRDPIKAGWIRCSDGSPMS